MSFPTAWRRRSGSAESGSREVNGRRVGLARALYVKPTVLVLDEATSSLDTATERRIVDTLAALEGQLTTIVVTHRIPTVRYCDRILYLEHGSARMIGPYDELTAFIADTAAIAARGGLTCRTRLAGATQ